MAEKFGIPTEIEPKIVEERLSQVARKLPVEKTDKLLEQGEYLSCKCRATEYDKETNISSGVDGCECDVMVKGKSVKTIKLSGVFISMLRSIRGRR